MRPNRRPNQAQNNKPDSSLAASNRPHGPFLHTSNARPFSRKPCSACEHAQAPWHEGLLTWTSLHAGFPQRASFLCSTSPSPAWFLLASSCSHTSRSWFGPGHAVTPSCQSCCFSPTRHAGLLSRQPASHQRARPLPACHPCTRAPAGCACTQRNPSPSRVQTWGSPLLHG